MRPYRVTWLAANPTYISGNNAIVAGQSLQCGPFAPNNVRPISLRSTANLIGINFTINGKLENGAPVTEVLAGPNNATIPSVNDYAEVDSIIPSASSVGNFVDVGIARANQVGNTSYISQFTHDYYNKQTLLSYAFENRSGTTTNLTPQFTLDLPVKYEGTVLFFASPYYNPAAPVTNLMPAQVWLPITTTSTAPAGVTFPIDNADFPSAIAFSAFPAAASRILVNSLTTADAQFDVVFLQQGGHY